MQNAVKKNHLAMKIRLFSSKSKQKKTVYLVYVNLMIRADHLMEQLRVCVQEMQSLIRLSTHQLRFSPPKKAIII